MTSNSRIPQHLAPYVEDVPKDSLILLTSTLSNSVNWLIVRCLCVPLSNEAIKARRVAPSQEELGESTNAVTDDVGVVLVSWMRDWEFWRTEARRAVGLDLASLAQDKRFAYVDGLSASSTLSIPQTPSETAAVPVRAAIPARTTLPIRGSLAGPSRPQAPTATLEPLAVPVTSSKVQCIPSLNLAQVRKSIEAALSSLTTSTALLILDAPDILLALQDPTTPSTQTSISSALQGLILSLRLHPRVHAAILSLSSDVNPLPSARPEHHIPSPIETESQALLVGLGHTSDLIVSARGLDTGAAGDVGGVLRITTGSDGLGKDWTEQELLYLVKTNGSAKVWERGAGVGVG